MNSYIICKLYFLCSCHKWIALCYILKLKVYNKELAIKHFFKCYVLSVQRWLWVSTDLISLLPMIYLGKIVESVPSPPFSISFLLNWLPSKARKLLLLLQLSKLVAFLKMTKFLQANKGSSHPPYKVSCFLCAHHQQDYNDDWPYPLFSSYRHSLYSRQSNYLW